MATPRKLRRRGGDAALRSAPRGRATSIDEVLKSPEGSTLLTVDGHIQGQHHCNCPPQTRCKPCREQVLLSSPETPREDTLRVDVPDATKLAAPMHLRMTFVICKARSGKR